MTATTITAAAATRPKMPDDHQASTASDHEPEQRLQDLSAIQRINRHQIENEQHEIDDRDREQEVREVGLRLRQAGRLRNDNGQDRDRRQNHVDERSGRNAPEQGSRSSGRLNVGNAAQRPKHDAIGLPADLSASQGMSELMQKHDAKQCQVLDDVPRHRMVLIDVVPDFEEGNQQPAPVQIHLDARNFERAGRNRW